MNDKVYEFNSSNAVGQLREIAITKWLENREDVSEVIDVSGDKFYQSLDIDLIVNKTDGSSYTVEIKTDTYVTGNLFFEVISNEQRQTERCLMKSDAQFLFYYFLKTKTLYILKMKKFRQFVLDRMDILKEKRVKNKLFTSRGFLVPLSLIEAEMKPLKKIQLN